MALVLPCMALAGSDFSSGVSDDRLSLPEGPGSMEGVGDNVDVDPNMALMRWSIPLQLPAGFAAVTPGLKLSYSSGSGNGVAGIGWSLDVESIERMTSRGLPEYDTDDLFVANGGEELVRVSTGTAPVAGGTIYRSRFERGFVRYLWLDDGSSGTAGHWQAQYPDGSVGYFGADHLGQSVAAAREAGVSGTFRYYLVEKVDVHGHVLRYDYLRDPGGRSLLDQVRWVFRSDGSARYSVSLSYEDNRPDVLSDGKAGLELRLTKRVIRLEVKADSELRQRLELTYDDETESGGLSRLRQAQSFGQNNAAFPVIHRFSYSQALGASCSGADCGEPYLVSVGGEPVLLGSGKATLVDLNGDALPDVVDTTAAGAHQIYLNQLASDGTQSFAAPYSSSLGTGSGHTLGSAYMQVLDANGDGFTDMLNALSGEVLLNKGTGDWVSKELLGASNGYPNLGEDAELRFLDYDNDRRIDVVHSDAANTLVWRNLDSAGFAPDAAAQNLGAGFASDNVQFADMNGDGLLDAVRVRQGEVSYRLNLGWGRWSGNASTWTTITGLPISDPEIDLAMLEDLNGDALADLLVVVGNQVRYALNRNGTGFLTAQTLTTVSGGSIPERTPQHTVLCADMNGNGSQDIVWIDGNGVVTYLELFPIRPHLMTRIENGIGRVTDVSYTTSVLEMALSREAGDPWQYKLPFPMNVVHSVDEYDLFSNLHDVTVYKYRDGFYDGEEKQYRGYAEVEILLPGEEGDEGSEQGLIVSSYDVGVTDPYRSGLKIRQTTEGDGRALREQIDSYGDDTTCPVAEVPSPEQLEAVGRKPVRTVCLIEELTYYKEGQTQDQWVHVTSRYEYDGYGNQTLEADLGITAVGAGGCGTCEGLAGHPCGAQCLGDEHYRQSWFVPTANTGGRWMPHLPYKTREYGDPASQVYSEDLTYYDGADFVGLGEGNASKGLVSRSTERLATDGTLRTTIRQRFDDDGNVVETIDPNGDLGQQDGHRRTYEYDALGLHPVRVEIRLQDAAGAPYQLRREVVYDPTWDKPVESTMWMRVVGGAVQTPRNSTYYGYDDMGRLTWRVLPGGDSAAAPTETYSYELASPVSRVITRSRTQVGGALDLEHIKCLDGRGRTVQERMLVESGQYQVAGFATFNLRGQVQRAYQPYGSTSASCDLTPPAGTPYDAQRYDALDRPLIATHQDADLYTSNSQQKFEYLPLKTLIFDEDDSDASSPFSDTPAVQHMDGLGRVLTVERLSEASGTPEILQVTYDELGNVQGYIDALGHEKLQRYDLAGRVVQIDDPNAGTLRYAYDDAGNVVRLTDGRGKVTRAAYDGNNRLFERFEDGNRDATLARAVYDALPACDAAKCTNLAGRLAALQYPAGEDRFGYNVRNAQIYTARQLEGFWFEVSTAFDNAGRMLSTRYPDGRVLNYGYDAASRPTSLGEAVPAIAYDAQGKLSQLSYGNGLTYARSYDSRMRPSEMSLRRGSTLLQGARYRYSRGNLLLESQDLEAPADDTPGLAAQYSYDARRRLTQAVLDPGRSGEETLSYGYDAIDNLLSATSSLGATSKGHVGSYTYGATQPNAVTTAGSLDMSYDTAGNMVARGDKVLAWDFMGRLVQVDDGTGVRTALAYGATRERVSKVEAEGVVHYITPEYQVKDGVATLSPRVDDLRLALLDSTAIQAQVLQGPAPLDNPDDAITAGDAWIAQAAQAGIVQSSEPASPVDRLLLGAARRLLVDNRDTDRYLHYDHTGSVTLATDSQGEITGLRRYFPYGGVRYQSGELGEFGFSGQEIDQGSGLLHFANRLLDPDLGRWNSVDPAFLTFTKDGVDAEVLSESTTGYAYVSDNPVSGFDPDGTGERLNAVGRGLKAFGKGAWKVIKSPYTLYKATRNALTNKLKPFIVKHPKIFAALRIATAVIALGLGIAATVMTFGAAAPVVASILVAGSAAGTLFDVFRTVQSAKTIVKGNKILAGGGSMSKGQQKLYDHSIDHIGGGFLLDVVGIIASTASVTRTALAGAQVTKALIGISLGVQGVKTIVSTAGLINHAAMSADVSHTW
ncbi:MAG: SpvB/TcaC N-terminal domain-containing protein [Pseudomonadota bacterium]